MGLRLYADAHAFGAALAATSGHLYSICCRGALDPAEVLRLEAWASAGQHQDLLGVTALRRGVEAETEAFFRAAARHDPRYRFVYSSKVVLAVTDYQDLQKIFFIRRHLAVSPAVDVALLVPDARLRHLFEALFAGASAPRTPALPGWHAWARFARSLLRTLVHRSRGLRPRVLVFTIAGPAPRAGADAYFGSLGATLGARTPTLSVYLAAGPALSLPHDAVTAPFEAYISPATVVATWLSALRTAPAAAAARDLDGDPLAPLHRYVRRAEIRSGEYFMQQLLTRGFAELLDRVAPTTLLYPFENRTWEKHLLAAAKSRGVRSIAYQHSSITPRHLAFHVAADEARAEHLPDRVVTLGRHTPALLRSSAPALAGRIVAGVSLRTSLQAVADAAGPAVLVAISSSRSEALSLLQATHAAATRVGLPFIIRTHPTIPVDAMYALFQWPPNVALSRGTTLADDLSRVTTVAYSSSTVALEGMLYGRLPIFVDIGDTPSGDPLAGDHAFKFVASDGTALANEVERITRLTPEALGALQAAARAFAENYLRPPTPEGIGDMVDAMLQP